MTHRAATILQEALGLDDLERAEVANALWESLEPESDPEVEAAWRQEVTKRVAALDAGRSELTAWEEIHEGFLAKLSERRAG